MIYRYAYGIVRVDEDIDPDTIEETAAWVVESLPPLVTLNRVTVTRGPLDGRPATTWAWDEVTFEFWFDEPEPERWWH